MRILLAILLASPTAALACGGFFCDSNQPVTQAAERILFAPGERDGTLQMHVQITYGGPPSEFGWLLPVPPDVSTGLSNPALFPRLDQALAPRFQLNVENDCPPPSNGGGGWADASASFDMGAPPEPDVQVLAREAVGPYDQAILAAASADDLLQWLDENAFNAPQDAADLLQGYIDNGSVFVALKLLPSASTDDVAPLRLEFTADQPVVPIRPTQLAAEPDMGLIVHVVGAARAVPTNYLHVIINERAIDWFLGGSNYADVVSQAADEANGHAFVTDFAGTLDPGLRQQLRLDLIGPDALEAIQAVRTFGEVLDQLNRVDEDLIVGLATVIEPMGNLTVRDMVATPWNYRECEVDGAAIAELIVNSINPNRESINAINEDNTYVSRLYTTLSPAEMQVDPIFAENVDLEGVSNRYQATYRDRGCFTGSGQLIFSDGSRMMVVDGQQGGVVERQAGETVRGVETNAAALIERTLSAGQPEVIERDRPDTSMPTNPPVPVPDREDDPAFNGGDEGGCDGCSTYDEEPPVVPLIALGVLGLLRRRR